jgi:hypothetical protein
MHDNKNKIKVCPKNIFRAKNCPSFLRTYLLHRKDVAGLTIFAKTLNVAKKYFAYLREISFLRRKRKRAFSLEDWFYKFGVPAR